MNIEGVKAHHLSLMKGDVCEVGGAYSYAL
jgi:hypothetical protein